MHFRLLSFLMLQCIVAIAMAADSPGTADSTRTITYYDGQRVTVPMRITRVATAWEAHNSILAMLGYGDKIVASTRVVREMPVFRKFVPSIGDAVLTSGGGNADINVEELMRVRPDVLFVAGSVPPAKAEQLRNAGIAVVGLKYNSLSAIVERTLITGEILGLDAYRKAVQYEEYFDRNVQLVNTALAELPVDKRLKVYHSVGSPTASFGRPSLNQDWMDLGGAINVAEHWFRGLRNSSGTVSIEEIMAADPDVIITMRAPHAEEIRTDKRWSNLRAVKTGRVYANPRGMFWWCRETSEQALQFLWVAKTLYPQLLHEVNMVEETRYFYKTFYGYNLNDAEIEEFLHPRS